MTLSHLFTDCTCSLPKLVMFDLDGTLVDSVPDLAAALNQMLSELGREPVALADVRTWVGNGARVLVRRALAGSMEHSAISEEQTEPALARFMAAYANAQHYSQLYPGALPTLKWLHKQQIEMALVSNKPEQFIAPLLDHLKIGRYFRWIIGGDTLAQCKPDPAALLFVLQMAGVTADEALFIGDSCNDVRAAHAAQVRCVALSYGYNHGRPIAEENPALVIDDLRELLPDYSENVFSLALDNPSATVLPWLKRLNPFQQHASP
ncbi:phosphoglycolate phosphatase [Ventosimonas gracilis]|uniref:phosphoglycolate phosphatase n=1 Tax=Ventosimonas gracilis TaxID=1680762 RepID=UPI0009A152C7